MVKKEIIKQSRKVAPCMNGCGHICEILERITMEGPDEANLRETKRQTFVELCPKCTLAVELPADVAAELFLKR